MSFEVSVVIPAYNAARFIGTAIDSALAQSYRPSEIIIIDDGSHDNTRSVVEKYNGIVKFIYQVNAGPAAARNRGIREASCEWIAFLDSDDYWDSEHLELLVKNADSNRDAALVYCGKKWVDEHGTLIQNSFEQTQFPSGWIFNDMFQANYISTTSVVLVRRDIVLKLGGFNETLRIAEDYDLWLRIAAISPICGVQSYTLNYRRHDSNLTLQSVRQCKSDLIVLDNAATMVQKGLVAAQNMPEQIDIRKRMKQSYTDAAIGMFYLGSFKDLRSLGLVAKKNRSLTGPLLIRWTLSWLPERFLIGLKKIYRYLK
jgi:glycosyltransferase involved in cell wall biosynthesis